MTRYDPNKHHRRSIRLEGYNYSEAGVYFITCCTKNREAALGVIRDDQVELSPLGKIVSRTWQDLPIRFPTVQLGAFVVMPNHIHGIIELTNTGVNVGAGLAPALDPANKTANRATARVAPTNRPQLGDVIRVFKSLSTMQWLHYLQQNDLDAVGKFWQRNYYEHIVRDEDDLNRIREYIVTNPIRWSLDNENPNRLDATDKWQVNEKSWFANRMDD